MLRDTGAVIAEEVWQPNHQRIPVRILHKYASEVWQRAGKEAAIDALRSVDVDKYAEFVLKSWLSLPLSFDGLIGCSSGKPITPRPSPAKELKTSTDRFLAG